jgi:lipoprotein signal peptidase
MKNSQAMSDRQPSIHPGRRTPELLYWITWTRLLVLLDQSTKAAVRAFLIPASSLPLIDGLVCITYIQNFRGLSWFVPDLPKWTHLVFFLLRVIIMALVFPVFRFYTIKVRQSRWTWIALLGVSAGILGNLIDDLFVPFTTDFLQVLHSPSANLADLYSYTGIISIGAEMIVWFRLRKPKWRGLRPFLVARLHLWNEFWAFLLQSRTAK